MSKATRSTRRIRHGVAPIAALVVCSISLASESDADGPIVNPVGPIEINPTPFDDEAAPAPPAEAPPEQTPEIDAASVGPPSRAGAPATGDEPGDEPVASRPLPPQESVPLGVPAKSDTPLGGANQSGTLPSSGKGSWVRQTGAALAVVLGLIFLGRYGLVAMARRSGGLSAMLGAGGRAPSGVMEILARYPVSRGHTLVLLKVDRRVLVLCHTASGFTTLTEFIEPEEVASILMRVRDEEGESMAARFSEMLSELSEAPADGDDPVSPRIALAREAVGSEPRERWSALRTMGDAS